MSSKFVKGDGREAPAVSTAALPDIVFMLLFYFMVAASIKSSNYEEFITVDLPSGSELDKVSVANLVNYIYVGIPTSKYVSQYGSNPTLMVANDKISSVDEIPGLVSGWRDELPPDDWSKMQVMLNIDKTAKLGIVQDIEDGLGASKLPRIVYSGQEGDIRENFQQ